MPVFGLVGKQLSHSFSKPYFEEKFRTLGLADHEYRNFELNDVASIRELIEHNSAIRGLNVTIPFKQTVIPYLDELSDEARAIGAVNCIVVSGDRLTGHNTDAYGFAQSIKPFLDTNHERALILGTGGASRAVKYVLNRIGLETNYVTTRQVNTPGYFRYEDLNAQILTAFKLVINTTPLGMYPHLDQMPNLPYDAFTPLHLACDLIYNPTETLFLKKAREAGAMVVNGLPMLHFQADKSWQIWHQGV